ncbi:MAG: hypothetical protein JW947_07230, partial [Sedimentisphaerales bacterium]|nr:hypothetical protein [Sedimentisphaerales bacterium]
PTFPYISKSTYVSVEVIDTTTGDPVPGGKIHLSSTPGTCPAGSFDLNDINVTTGVDYTKWNAPDSDGDATITATYQPDQPYIAAGCRYFTSSDNEIVTVVKDYDTSDPNLKCMIEWIADYSSWPPNVSIASTQDSSEGFANVLKSVCGWQDANHGNSGARAYHLRHRWLPLPYKPGKENDYMDKADFTWYNGHGSPGAISFTHPYSFPYYDRVLNSYEATDVLTNPEWGNKDAEWIAMKSCQVLSVPDKWAGTMDGLHLICGFHTASIGCGKFGPLFAGFMVQESVTDKPLSIVQAWFLTADMTQPNDRRQRVVGETSEMLGDYLWGQGPVNQDTVVDGAVTIEHDVNNHTPVADAGGPYIVTVGQPVVLDGSGTTDADTYSGSKIYYVWDMDVNSNTDSNDYDGDDTDDTDDDYDVCGRSGSYPDYYIFNTTGTYTIRLNVHDDTYNYDSNTTTVTVNSAPPPPFAGEGVDSPAASSYEGELEIVDNFNPATLPTEIQLPVFRVSSTEVGYNEVQNIAGYYGMTANGAALGVADNWNIIENSRELIINQHTGSVMYVDKDSVYIYPNYAPSLPPEPTAISLANSWLTANGISTMDVVMDGTADISYAVISESSHHYVSKTPFQRRVNYRRIMNVEESQYPVVGPGGKITVMMDDSYDIRMFVKICREAFSAEPVSLLASNMAVQQFHNLSVKALIKESRLPVGCTKVEIDNVSIGYYEDDFVTQQDVITPVYILDLTCLDNESSQTAQVYMSAMTEPLNITIDDPCTPISINLNDDVNFACTAQGGTSPYSYRWSSDVDGLLSTEASFTASTLSARHLVDSCVCEKLPHSISVTVTDSYGLTATEFVDVTVWTPCSDFNGDGIVNFDDFADLASAWLAGAGEANYDAKADLFTDNIININDLCVLTNEWLQ